MFEQTIKDTKKALSYAKKLLYETSHDPKHNKSLDVPENIGVYLWKCKKTGKEVYVGRALGRKGLLQRIVRQHLSESYTKSVFKKHIAQEQLKKQNKKYNNEELKEYIKGKMVKYIEDHFTFSYIPLERDQNKLVCLIEFLLIHELDPKYNKDK